MLERKGRKEGMGDLEGRGGVARARRSPPRRLSTSPASPSVGDGTEPAVRPGKVLGTGPLDKKLSSARSRSRVLPRRRSNPPAERLWRSRSS